jgi:hypothetical protein
MMIMMMMMMMIGWMGPQVTMGDRSTGPVVFSVILFVNPKQLKDELNRQFRDKHPELPPSLTLSKIRSLKVRRPRDDKHAPSDRSHYIHIYTHIYTYRPWPWRHGERGWTSARTR